MKGQKVRVQKASGEIVKATIIYEQGDNATVQTEDGFVIEVDREANHQGIHVATGGNQ